MGKVLSFVDEWFIYAGFVGAAALYFAEPGNALAYQNTTKPYLIVAGTILAGCVLLRYSLHKNVLALSTLNWNVIGIMVVVMIASNLFFLYLTTLVDGIQLAVRPLEISYVLGYFAFKGIRIFVEESVFRGFLLVPGISGSNRVFWIANLSQALVFAVVHLLIPNAPLHHYALGMFAFVSSLVYGLLNRRAGSLLPSWIIHLTNGVLGSLVFA